MADPISIGILAASVIGTGTGLYGAKRSREVAAHGRETQQALADEASANQSARERAALEQRTVTTARAEQKRKQLLAMGLGSTTKTSPLGLPGGGMKFNRPTLIGGTPGAGY